MTGERGKIGIAAVWRGEVPLGRVFWILGVLGQGALVLGLGAFVLALAEPPEAAVANLFLAALGLILAYTVWVFVGIWRSAGHADVNPVWMAAARLWVASGVFLIALVILGVLDPPSPL